MPPTIVQLHSTNSSSKKEKDNGKHNLGMNIISKYFNSIADWAAKVSETNIHKYLAVLVISTSC